MLQGISPETVLQIVIQTAVVTFAFGRLATKIAVLQERLRAIQRQLKIRDEKETDFGDL